MAESNIRKNILGIVNEARKKFAVASAASLTSDSESELMVEILNDVIDEVSDYGDWKEAIREIQVTASSSVSDYVFETSALVKNIHEVTFDTDISPMWLTTFDDILRLGRINSYSRPRQWAIVGVDTSSANPIVRVFPTPGTNQNNKVFKVTYYQKPRLYTTSDASAVPVFPAKVLVAGLVAKKCLEESGGQSTQQYVGYLADYQNKLKEAYNRFNSDSGSDSYFRPGYGKYRRK